MSTWAPPGIEKFDAHVGHVELRSRLKEVKENLAGREARVPTSDLALGLSVMAALAAGGKCRPVELVEYIQEVASDTQDVTYQAVLAAVLEAFGEPVSRKHGNGGIWRVREDHISEWTSHHIHMHESGKLCFIGFVVGWGERHGRDIVLEAECGKQYVVTRKLYSEDVESVCAQAANNDS